MDEFHRSTFGEGVKVGDTSSWKAPPMRPEPRAYRPWLSGHQAPGLCGSLMTMYLLDARCPRRFLKGFRLRENLPPLPSHDRLSAQPSLKNQTVSLPQKLSCQPNLSWQGTATSRILFRCACSRYLSRAPPAFVSHPCLPVQFLDKISRICSGAYYPL